MLIYREIKKEIVVYSSKLDFQLDTTKIGDSEMQHLDYAYSLEPYQNIHER